MMRYDIIWYALLLKKTRDGGGGGVMIGMISIAVAVYVYCVIRYLHHSHHIPIWEFLVKREAYEPKTWWWEDVK